MLRGVLRAAMTAVLVGCAAGRLLRPQGRHGVGRAADPRVRRPRRSGVRRDAHRGRPVLSV